MKLALLSLICLLSLAATTVAQSGIKLKIGATLPHRYLPREDDEHPVMASSESQVWPFIEAKVRGVKYIIGFDDGDHRIRFIHTIDRAFRTADGLHVGSKTQVTLDQLNVRHFWYTFAGTTRDGWQIIVADTEESLSNMKAGETRTVTIGGFSKVH